MICSLPSRKEGSFGSSLTAIAPFKLVAELRGNPYTSASQVLQIGKDKMRKAVVDYGDVSSESNKPSNACVCCISFYQLPSK